MAAWDNVEGFEFQHDLITPSLDRQATCLSLSPTENRRGLDGNRVRMRVRKRNVLLFCQEKTNSLSVSKSQMWIT